MPATFTETQIRTAIETVLNASTTNAVVFPFWVLGHDETQVPIVMKNTLGQVHGYIITRTDIDGAERVEDRKNVYCVDTDLTYAIWGFHFYDTGTRTANTDLTFNTELDAIRDAFRDASLLPAELARAGAPTFNIDLRMFGGELLHRAVGRLIIKQL